MSPAASIPLVGHPISWWSDFDRRFLARLGYSGSGVVWKRSTRVLGRRAEVAISHHYFGEDDHWRPSCLEGRLFLVTITFDRANDRLLERVVEAFLRAGYRQVVPVGPHCADDRPGPRFSDSLTNVDITYGERARSGGLEVELTAARGAI